MDPRIAKLLASAQKSIKRSRSRDEGRRSKLLSLKNKLRPAMSLFVVIATSIWVSTLPTPCSYFRACLCRIRPRWTVEMPVMSTMTVASMLPMPCSCSRACLCQIRLQCRHQTFRVVVGSIRQILIRYCAIRAAALSRQLMDCWSGRSLPGPGATAVPIGYPPRVPNC